MTDVPHRAFVVIAEFVVQPGRVEEFLTAARADAASAKALEPACRAFDASVPQDAPDHVVLYEVYDDRAAFEAHLQTPHCQRFAATVTGLTIGEPAVRMLTRLS